MSIGNQECDLQPDTTYTKAREDGESYRPLAKDADNRRCVGYVDRRFRDGDGPDCYHHMGLDSMEWCESCREFYEVTITVKVRVS